MSAVSIRLVLTLAIMALSPIAWSQTITVRLLNAKSGKPMAKRNVTIKWDKDLLSSQAVVDGNGIAHIEVPKGAKYFSVLPGPKPGREPERIAYQNCNDPKHGLISVSDTLKDGTALKNVCTDRYAPANPGEVVFWALPNSILDMQ